MDNNLEEKGKIVLARINARIDNGEFDGEFNLPFMSKKMFKKLINHKIDKEVSEGGNPVLSNTDIKTILEDLRETARETFRIFLENGILEVDENKNISLSSALK